MTTSNAGRIIIALDVQTKGGRPRPRQPAQGRPDVQGRPGALHGRGPGPLPQAQGPAQGHLPRPQAPRHPQHGGRGRPLGLQARRPDDDHPHLGRPGDDGQGGRSGQGRGRSRQGPQAHSPRRHGPDQPQGRRPRRGGHGLRRRLPGPAPGGPGQGGGPGRGRLLAPGDRGPAQGVRAGPHHRHAGDPARLGGGPGPEEDHDPGRSRGQGSGLSRHRAPDHRGARRRTKPSSGSSKSSIRAGRSGRRRSP